MDRTREGDRRGPGDYGDGERPALAAYASDPAAEQARRDRADRDGRVQQPDPAAEPCLRHLREQRGRHGQGHRRDVDRERHPEHRGGGDEAQPVEHRAQATRGGGAFAGGLDRGEAQGGKEEEGEQQGVGAVGPAVAVREGDQDARDQRSCDLSDVAGGEVQRVRGGHERGRHDTGNDRAPGRGGHGERAGLHGDEAEDERDRTHVGDRLEQQGECDDPGQTGRGEVQRTAVEPVGDGTAVQPEDHERYEAGDPCQPHEQ